MAKEETVYRIGDWHVDRIPIGSSARWDCYKLNALGYVLHRKEFWYKRDAIAHAKSEYNKEATA